MQHACYNAQGLVRMQLVPGGKEAAPFAEKVFLDNLPLIEQVIRYVSLAHGLRGADAEDFASHAKLKLIEDDYGVFRKFHGRCTLKTYLNTVISRLCINLKIHNQGRWRPSVDALRMGEAAIRLEELVFRRQHTLQEATEMLLQDHRFSLDRSAVRKMYENLPHRHLRTEIQMDEEHEPSPSMMAQSSLLRPDAKDLGRKLMNTINRFSAALTPQDRLILRLRFEENLKISEIASSLRLDQRPLYARMQKILQGFREALAADGITSDECLESMDLIVKEIHFSVGDNDAP